MSASTRRPGAMVASGVGAGLVFTCLVSGLVGYTFAKRLEADKRKGWNLVPIVVAADVLEAGAPVDMEHLSQRSIPEQFVTSSMVRPEAAMAIVGRTTRLPLNAGDALPWSAFEASAADADCSKLVDALLVRRVELFPTLEQVGDAVRRHAGVSAVAPEH